MEQAELPVAAAPPVNRKAGRGHLWLGILCAVVGVAGYVIQLTVLKLIIIPWYAPIAGTLGFLLVLISLYRRFTITRTLVALALSLIAGFQWLFLFSFTLAPEYLGPVQVGGKLPTFTATYSDGRLVTEKDLEGDKNTALVFFRGRW